MHIPVLLNEVIKVLNPKSGENFIDATVSHGGHAQAILEKIQPGGKVLGIECDEKVMQNLKLKTENGEYKSNLILVNDSYVNLERIIWDLPAGKAGNNFQRFNGILFDLGMSNWHVEESGKGFSFLRDESLDMRYDVQGSLTAKEIANDYSQEDLERIIREYGEESFSRPIAEAIVKARRGPTIQTTGQLVEIIKNAVPFWYRRKRIHFATKTFQALRIEVNQELENVKQGISKAIELAPSGCRIAVITFHSLEDRIVKNLFKEGVKSGIVEFINKKPIIPSYTEVRTNPKARSAKLRAIIKT